MAAEDGSQVAGRSSGHLGVGRPLVGVVDDVHDLGRAEAPERQPEVERRADHHHHVGLGLEQTAGPAERQLVVGGQAAPAQAVDERRHPQRSTTARSASHAPAQYTSLPDHHRRSLGRGQQPGRLGHIVRVGLDGSIDASRAERRRPRPFADDEHDVEREVEEHRAAVRASAASRASRVDARGDVVDRADGRPPPW